MSWFKRVFGSGSSKRKDSDESGVTDVDGNTYGTVRIGDQEWMTKNLNVEHFRNGEAIPELKSDKWDRTRNGAWCYYDNKAKNGKSHGKLYNWFAVNDARGLAPSGWHIPTDKEWETLVRYLGGEKLSAGKLKARDFWKSGSHGATNESGFTALPGGSRDAAGDFGGLGEFVGFWSSTERSKSSAWFRRCPGHDSTDVIQSFSYKEGGFSVRCIKDS